MRKFIFLMMVTLLRVTSYGQMLYNNGAVLYINDKNSTSVASLRVNGSITNNDGNFTNNVGLVEITGDWTNTITSNNYNSTGIERFIGTANQLISGTWNGISGNNNQFYNLYVNKSSGYVSLGQNTHVNSSGSIQFESTGGIIRTATSSSSNTGDYTYYIYLQNPATASLSGYSWPNGTTKYIEGKLKRQVNSASTYQFPIGFQPSDKDGMEAFQVKFNSAPVSTGLLGYIRPAANLSINSDLITNGTILFYDIGAFINPNNNFSQCTGGPDGHDDVAAIDQAIVSEWMATPDAGSSFNYDITVYPGSLLDNITYATMGAPCNGTYTQAKYLARDGRIGGNGAVGPTTNYWVPGVQGLYQAPTGTTLTNQNGFSRFRLFGASDNNTSLPVELLSFTGFNAGEYNSLNWITASELNTSKFIVEKSIDGQNWAYLGEIQAAGNSSVQLTYSLNDYSPTQGNNYYRLKMVDLDNTYKYSNTINIPVNGTLVNAIVSIYPNPVSNMMNVDIQSTSNTETDITIYDVLGQIVIKKPLSLLKGINKLQFDCTTLAQASYVVQFTDNLGKTHTQKFIKQ